MEGTPRNRDVDGRWISRIVKHKRGGPRAVLALVLALLAAAGLAGAAWAAAGNLDTSFGDGGYVVTDMTPEGSTGANDEVKSMALQSDGKIVAVGPASKWELVGSGSYREVADLALVRYESNGALDSSFGTGGKVYTNYGTYTDWQSGNRPTNDKASSVAIDSQDRILVSGYGQDTSGNYKGIVARYEPDGTLDTTLDGDGIVLLENSSWLDDVAVQADDKIVVTNSRPYQSTNVYRLNTNGSLDTSFGTGGSSPISSMASMALAIQPDGKILLGGTKSQDYFSLVRLNTNGQLDTAFGSGGQVNSLIGNWASTVEDLAIQPNGAIVATGWAYSGDYTRFASARYLANGTLDTTFSGDGKVVTDVNGPVEHCTDDESAQAVAVQPDGKIVVAGNAVGPDCTGRGGVVRYNANGSLDTAFSGDGDLIVEPRSSEEDTRVWDLALASEGKKILVGGSSITCCDPVFHDYMPDFTIVSYDGGGAADTTKPTVSLTAPADGSTVSGTSVALKADATDDKAVTRVDFYVGSTKVGSDSTAGGTSGKEYSYTWDSTSVLDGSQTITARAYDAANNEKISSSRTITVDNSSSDTEAPTITSTTPTSSETGVARNIDLTIAFSEQMDPDTLTASTVTLHQKQWYQIRKKKGKKVRKVWTYRWVPVSASVSCDDQSSCETATVDPASDLVANTNYLATVTTGAKDAAGTAMAQNYSWSFTTGSS